MAKKVIRLTEADIEKLVQKVLSEQENTSFGGGTRQVQTGTKTELTDINVDLASQVFEPGKYKITSLGADGERALGETIFKIVTFLKENPNSTLNIEIIVGESVVPNYDREECQDGIYNDKCKLGEGELGKLRGEELINYLNTEFKRYETDGVITKAPTITSKPNVIVGRKHKTYGKDPKNPKYEEDQFIRFNATLSGEVETPVYDTQCLVDMKVTLQYINEKNNKKFPCRGIHKCDKATYQVFMNTTLLGIANLDNENDGGNRTAEFIIDTDKVQKIAESELYQQNQRLTLWIKCNEADKKCHNSAIEVKIENKQGEVKVHSCLKPLNVQLDTKDAYTRLPEAHLLYMDKCGEVIEKNLSDEDDSISLSDLVSQKDKRLHAEAVNSVVNYYSQNPFNQTNMAWFRRVRGGDNITAQSIDGQSTYRKGRGSYPAVILTVKTNNTSSQVPVDSLPSGGTKNYFLRKNQQNVTIPSGKDVKIVVPMNEVNVPEKSKTKFEKSLMEDLETYKRTFYKIEINGEPYIVNAAGTKRVDVKRVLGKDEKYDFKRGISKINYV